MTYSIVGAGAVGAFGCSKADLASATSSDTVSLSKHTISAADKAVDVDCFKADATHLTTFLPKNQLRRTDHFSQLALLATYLALEHTGVTEFHDKGEDIGLIVATGYGAVGSTCSFKDSINSNGDIGASPMQFTKSVHNQACSHMAIQLGVTGPNLTVSQHYLSFHTALQTACIWLEENRVKRVIVGGVDEFSDVHGYSRLRFLNERFSGDSYYPGIHDRSVFPGEGAGFFLLEKQKDRDYPQISMPTIGRVDENTKDCLERCERTIIYGDSSSRKISNGTLPENNRENSRCLYGEFPTASAIDLAYALFTGKPNMTTCCMQLTNENRCGILTITG